MQTMAYGLASVTGVGRGSSVSLRSCSVPGTSGAALASPLALEEPVAAAVADADEVGPADAVSSDTFTASAAAVCSRRACSPRRKLTVYVIKWPRWDAYLCSHNDGPTAAVLALDGVSSGADVFNRQRQRLGRVHVVDARHVRCVAHQLDVARTLILGATAPEQKVTRNDYCHLDICLS
jgi:hypothetical protein